MSVFAPPSSHAPLIDWRRVDLALFDMDGVLLDLAFDRYFWETELPRRYALARSISLTKAHAEIRQIAPPKGTRNWYSTDYWSLCLGLDVISLKLDLAHRIAWLPGARDFLSAMGRHGIRCWLVSNAHRDVIRIKCRRTRLHLYFERLISAVDYAAPKENDDFWRVLQARHPFDSQRALLIDDTAAVLEAGQRHGIAQLLTISLPDTSLPARPREKFPACDDFSQLLPLS